MATTTKATFYGEEMTADHALMLGDRFLEFMHDGLTAFRVMHEARGGWEADQRTAKAAIAALTERKGALTAEITALTQQHAETEGKVAEARATHTTEMDRMSRERDLLAADVRKLRGEQAELVDALGTLRAKFAG